MFHSCICKTIVGLANFDQFIRMRNWISYYPEPGPGKEEDASSEMFRERGRHADLDSGTAWPLHGSIPKP